VDIFNVWKKEKNIKVMMKAEHDKFWAMMLQALEDANRDSHLKDKPKPIEKKTS